MIQCKNKDNRSNLRRDILVPVFACALVLFFLASFVFGRYPVSPAELLGYMKYLVTGSAPLLPESVIAVISQIRFPRIAGAVMLGAALSMSGASYQGIFKNPMVSPDILGASAGAGFGASLAILLSLSNVMIQAVSFIFGIAAVMLTYIISAAVGKKDHTTLVLILSGMVVSSLFSAFISVAKYTADPYSKLPQITLWLMGSLSDVTMGDIKVILLPVLLCSVFLNAVRWRLNVLSFGDEEAESLGVNTKRLRIAVVICSTMLTASVVSIAGMIGWVGLVIPHFARMMAGPDYKTILPLSALLGGCFMLVIDNISRNLLPVEIPLGILTAILGAPFFVYLLLKGKRGWL